VVTRLGDNRLFILQNAAFTYGDYVDFWTTYLSLVHVITPDDLVGTVTNGVYDKCNMKYITLRTHPNVVREARNISLVSGPQSLSNMTKKPRLRTAKPESEASSDDRLSLNLRERKE